MNSPSPSSMGHPFAPPAAEPFPRRTTNYDSFAPLPSGESSPLPPLGVERRIVRRAETLWRRLCGTEALPPANAAKALLAAPFTSCAMLYVGRYPVYAGAELARIGVTLSQPAPHSFAARLSGLAASAVRKGRPMLFDTRNPDAPESLLAAHLLARAVALPFAPSRNHLSSVVVVASWRQLLPEKATSALHREMAKTGS